MAETVVDDELWDDFHRVVNMSSRELGDWLRTEAASAVAEREPDHSGPEIGRQVLAILGKRRTDLTADDVTVMRRVVATITAERRDDLEPVAGDAQFRHRLMCLGHDPLKAA